MEPLVTHVAHNLPANIFIQHTRIALGAHVFALGALPLSLRRRLALGRRLTFGFRRRLGLGFRRRLAFGFRRRLGLAFHLMVLLRLNHA